MSRRLTSSYFGAAFLLLFGSRSALHGAPADGASANIPAVSASSATNPQDAPQKSAEPAPESSGSGTSIADSLSREVRTVFRHAQKAVVKIEAEDKEGRLFGTGFFIDPNGTILTSYSVGGESHDIIVSHGDIKYPAARLIADCRSGIALLKIEASTPFLPIGTSEDVMVATPVVTVAYPMDMPLTPNFGMVAGRDIKYLGRYFATTHIRANVPVQRGEGGAPLLNMKGEVIGIVISSLDGGASCFAVPVEAAEKIQRDYVRFGMLRPGWLGMTVVASEEPDHGSTATVQKIEDDSPAEKGGLRKGDVLSKIGNREIKAPEDVLNAFFYLTAGDPVPITVYRGNQELTLQVQPGERSAGSTRRLRPFSALVATDDITLRVDRQSPSPAPDRASP